jgi:transposase
MLVSLFCLRQSRAASVALEVLGSKRLPGVLVVDRYKYKGYNQAPCAIQYCYAHLLREVQDLVKEFLQAAEVLRFVASLARLMAHAIKLRAQGLKRPAFGQRALELKLAIKSSIYAPAQHPGIQLIQNIFRENASRLYHWSKSPTIPAENNRAERELRRLVISRKISFGSQSGPGARTREIFISVLPTLRKRTEDVFGAFKRCLDTSAEGEKRDPYKLLFDSS